MEVNLNNLMEEWLNHKKYNVKTSTLSTYSRIIEQLVKDIETIDNINKNYLNEYIKGKTLVCSPKYVQNIVMVLNMLIHYFYQRKIIDKDFKIRKPIKINKTIKVLNPLEYSVLKDYLIKNISYKNLGLLITFYTGLRIGEICALTWENINFESSMFEISKTVQRVKNFDKSINKKTIVIIDTPKSSNSIREIPINEEILKVIKKMHGLDNNYILTNQEFYIEPRSYENHFKRVLKACGIKTTKFHVLRHTFATRCLESGIDIKTLSIFLGHSNTQITMDTYLHISPEFKKKEMKKLKI